MKKIIIVGLVKPKVIRTDSSELVARIGLQEWQNLFGNADLNIESRIINDDRAIPEFQKLSSELQQKKPDAVLVFETIPGITQILFEVAIYGPSGTVCHYTINAEEIIRELRKNMIPAGLSCNENQPSLSYTFFSVANYICSHELPIKFGLIHLPLATEEVCRNNWYHSNPSFSRETLINAAKIICELS